MKVLIQMAAAALLLSACASSGQTNLSKNGVTNYEIVTSSNATAAESHAAKELKGYLEQSTKAQFRIVDEKSKGAGPAIYIGATEFATKNNLSQTSLDSEEWAIKNVGKDLIITGGRPRGVLYGVYEFLEKFAGCRWYDMNTELVPSISDFNIPAHIDIKEKPAFKGRSIYYLVKNIPYEKFIRFYVHCRFNGSEANAELGFSEKYGSPRACHNYLNYSEGFPAEYFSMDKDGKRIKVSTQTGGQICFSNPNVRRLFAEKLRKYVKDDREKAKKLGYPNPVFYDISANDCSVLCHCNECKALAEKYGVSGMVLDFTNSIAEAIEKEYPDILIMMSAYKEAENPPHGIKARDNVVVRLACMDIEFGAKRDVLRPLSAPQNQYYMDTMNEWYKSAKNVAIWDYWKMYYDQFPSPKTCISNRAEYLKKYRDIGALHIFVEAEIDAEHPDSFIDLRNYIGSKLMINPDIDTQAVIKDFMNGFYGKAALPMKKYLDYLETRMAEEKLPLCYIHPSKRAFLDEAFFTHVNELLSEAEKLAAEQPGNLANVSQERLVVDIAYINMFDKFPDNPLKLSKEKILNRILANLDTYGGKYYAADYWAKAREKTFADFKSKVMDRPAIPKQFAEKTVIDMIWSDFADNATVEDNDAAGAKAICVLPGNYSHKEPFHGRDVAFGVYSKISKKRLLEKTIAPKDLPQDEKYHFYYLGRTVVPENSVLWLHWTWHFQGFLKNVYDPFNSDTLYDVYVSIKLQGPSYVKSSIKPDDFRMDRAIFVKVLNKNDAPIPMELQQLK